MLLAIVMALSTVTFTWAEPVAQAEQTKTLGQLLVDNYDSLTKAEQDLLTAKLLNEAGYTYTAPDENNGGGLVSIDAERKTVTAKAYTNNEYTWVPVSAQLMVGDQPWGASFELTDNGNDAYTGSFSYDGTSYGVAVKYEMYITVELDEQNGLLSAAKNLKAAKTAAERAQNGAEQLNQILQTKIKFSKDDLVTNLFGSNLPDTAVWDVFATMNPADGGGIPLRKENPTESISYWTSTADEQVRMKEMTDDAKDGLLDVCKMWRTGGLAADMASLSANYAAVSAAVTKAYAQGQLTESAVVDLNGKIQNGGLNTAVASLLATMVADLKYGAEFDWSVVADLVKDGADGAALDSKLDAITTLSGTTATKDELLADTTTVTANMAQATVNVVVKADVIPAGATETTTVLVDSGDGATVRLAAASAESDIAAAIAANGFETRALSGWTAYDVSEANYTRTVTVSPAIGADGLKDNTTYTYTISYTPKTFAITATGCDDITVTSAAYGYTLTLPAHADKDLVWDYTVNGVSYEQGAKVRIVDDTTITRKAGKAWEQHNLGQLIGKNYAADDAAANAILGQNALLTGVVKLRTPTNDDALLTVAAVENGYTVQAKTFNASTDGMQWIPSIAIPVVDGKDQAPVEFVRQENGTYLVNIENEFDTVKVQYALQLTWGTQGLTAEQATNILNLPYTLAQEAEGQIEALNKLASQYSNLEQVSGKALTITNFVCGDQTGKVSQETKDAASDMLKNCCDSNNNYSLILFGYVTAYKELNSAARLAYYYQNAEAIRTQLAYLNSYLTIIKDDPGLEYVLNSQGMGEYYGKIDNISATLQETVNNLVAPNKAIDTTATSAGLTELAAALIANADSVQEYAAVTEAPVLTTVLTAAGIGKKSVTVNVIVENSNGVQEAQYTQTTTFSDDEGQKHVTIDTEKRAALDKVMGDLLANVDLKHYEVKTAADIPAEGTKLDGDLTVTAVYAPKTYTVNIVDESGAPVDEIEFAYDHPSIVLPASGETGFRYDYSIGGQVISAPSGTYTFNMEATGDMAFDTLFANGSCTIVRTKVDTAREKLMASVEAVNKALATGSGMTTTVNGQDGCLRVAVIPYEVDGKLTLVVRLVPSTAMKPQSAVKGVAEQLLNYSAIQVGEKDQYFANGGRFDLQAAVDAVLNSGVGMDTILGLINAEGDIVESTIEGGTLLWTADAKGGYAVDGGYVNSLDTIGGQLMSIDTKFDGTPVSVVFTLEDFDQSASALQKARSNVQTLKDKGIDATLDNGSVNVSVDSNLLYKALMGSALVLNRADVNNVTESGWDLSEIVPELYYSLVDPVMSDDRTTTTTFQNTLTKLGITKYDVTKYQRFFRIAKAILRDSSFSDTTGDATSMATQLTFDMTNLLGKISDKDLSDMVAQRLASKTLNGRVSLTLTHSQEYAAVVMHAQKSAKGLVKFIPSSADSSFTVTQSNTAIVLLDDSCKQITVGEGCSNVIIDLNGHKLGKVVSSESDRVIVINSYITKGGLDNPGNATDGSALAKQLYTVTRSAGEDGENISVSLVPDASLWRDMAKTRRNVLALAAEAVSEVVMSYGNATKKVSVNINGVDTVLYDLQLNDFADMVDTASVAGTGNLLVGCLNLDGINALANDIIRKLSDFDGINTAIENKEDIVSYTVTATGFGLQAEVTDSDYISVSTKDGQAEVVNLSVNLNQSEQYTGAIDRIQGILTVLDDTLTVDESTMVELQKILVSGDRSDVNVSAEGAATVKASIDAKHNINYVIFPAMIVANSLPEGDALRAELVAGIQDVLDGKGQNALKTAVEKVTSQQLFTALKGLTAKPIFQAQANKLGLNITLDTQNSALMNSFGDLIYAAGRGLSYAKINGNSGTLAGLKTDTYGEYNIKYVNKVLDITRSAKMLTGTAKATFNIDLMAALFTEEKDIVVKDHTGAYKYNGNDLAEALAFINCDTEGVTLVLNNKSQTLTGDLEISVPLTIEGYALNLDGHQFVLTATTASITMDGITADLVDSGVDGWYVDVTEYKAYLVQYPVKANGVPYKDLDVALAMLDGKGTLEILTDVTLTQNVEVKGELIVTGAAKITQGSYNFVLKTTDSKLVSDAALNVTTDLSGYVVNQEGFTYTVIPEETQKAIIVKGHDDSVIWSGDDLAEALKHINDDAEGVTLVLNESQKLTGDVDVNVPLTVEGKALDMNGHKFVLKSTDASVTMEGLTANMVTTDVDGWYVVVSGNKATLKKYVAKVNGDYCKTLEEAINKLNGSGTLELLDDVTMTADIQVTGTVTVKNANKITQGSYNFVLANKDATLVSDARLNVKTTVSGCKVKTTGNYTYTVVAEIIDGDKLYLDVKPEGINASQLQMALRDILKMPNANVEVLSGLVVASNNEKLIANGAVAKVTNGDDVYQYTIIIMGDTNCNGRTDAGDNVLMRRHFQKAGTLTGIAFDAADMNRDGTIKSNDAVLNRSKFMRWSSYVSHVNKVLY